MSRAPASSSVTTLAAALDYTARGWHVFPCHHVTKGKCSCGIRDCHSPGKHPRTKAGLKDGTTDKRLIHRWWKRWPKANIAIRTGGLSGIVALDIDLPEGPQTIHELQQEHDELPACPVIITGSGGRQFIFAHPGGELKNRTRFAPGLDFRADNGYVVVPPSNHATGGAYRWLDDHEPDDCQPPAMPEWLFTLICQPQRNQAEVNGRADGSEFDRLSQAATQYVAKIDGVSEGHRDATAFSLAGHLFAFRTESGHRLSETQVLDFLRTWNHRNQPPLGEDALAKCLSSAKTNGTPRQDKLVKADSAGLRSGMAFPRIHDLHQASGRTEAANAQRLIALHGRDLRYCDPWRKWLIYDGQRWRIDDQRVVDTKAKDVSRKLWFEGARMASEDPESPAAKEVLKFAKSSNSAQGVRHMIELGRSEPGNPTLPDEWDRDTMLLNVANGTIELRSGKLREHRRTDQLTKLADVSFDPKATCPRWERFFYEVFRGDSALISFLQRAIGYTLTGDTSERCLFFLHGTGRNGKTTLLSVIQKLAGDYATTMTTELLMVSQGNRHPTELTDLAGRRMAIANETEDGRRFAESLVKQMSGGEDRMKARRMREDFWEFDTSHKLWIAGNHKPRIRGTDPAIWDRIRLIPFNVRFNKPDKKLIAKLARELPGILNWALRGCLEWQQHGLGEPAIVTDATNAYRAEMDALGAFLDECCVIEERAIAGATSLFKTYKRWCDDTGETPISQTAFGTQLSERGFEKDKPTSGPRKNCVVYYGLGLRDGGAEVA